MGQMPPCGTDGGGRGEGVQSCGGEGRWAARIQAAAFVSRRRRARGAQCSNGVFAHHTTRSTHAAAQLFAAESPGGRRGGLPPPARTSHRGRARPRQPARARAGGLASFIACARDDSDDDGTLQPSSNMTQYIVCPEDRAAPSGDAVPPNSAPTSWRVPLYTAPICIWSRTHYRRGGPLADVGMDRRY